MIAHTHLVLTKKEMNAFIAAASKAASSLPQVEEAPQSTSLEEFAKSQGKDAGASSPKTNAEAAKAACVEAGIEFDQAEFDKVAVDGEITRQMAGDLTRQIAYAAGSPVGGFLAYASVVNIKVGGVLGINDSIVVQHSPAVTKSAPAVPFGLLALDRHAHLNVLAYLHPNWVRWREWERERRRRRGEEWSHVGRPHLRLKKIHHHLSTFLVLSFAVGGTFRAVRVDPACGKIFRRK